MIHAYKTNFFIVAALWLNAAKASEYRSLPVPRYPQTYQSSGKSFFVLPHIPHIHMPKFGKLFENVSFSPAIKIVQEHKMMFGIATSVIFLSLLVKQLQKSETWKQSLREEYVAVEKQVDAYTDNCIAQCPLPVRLAIKPLKIVLQFLCDAIKRYVAMNKKKIMFSVGAPVAGRLLDGLLDCRIFGLDFKSVGWMLSTATCIKGYFDSGFEHIDERFDGLEAKIDTNQSKIVSEISNVKTEVGLVTGLLQSVSQQSSAGIQLIKAYGQKLKSIASQVSKLENMGQQNTQQLGSIESQVLSLKRDLGLMRKSLEQSHEDNKKLHDRLIIMEKNSDTRFDTLEGKIEEGVSRIEHKLDNPTVFTFPGIENGQYSQQALRYNNHNNNINMLSYHQDDQQEKNLLDIMKQKQQDTNNPLFQINNY